MLRVSFSELQSVIAIAFERAGVQPHRAQRCATLFAQTTRDGVYTHGLNRLSRLLATIENGCTNPVSEPSLISANAALEAWDSNYGIGNLNAEFCMNRAAELARQYGIGCIALRNTSHWMRGGTYGWQAADNGLFSICWTNTNPNTPAWGTAAPTLGNNPFVMAVPRINPETGQYKDGPHVVLDMAISQYSYGQIDAHRARGEQLAYPGGFDVDGNLTTDPAAIRKSYRALPIGFWKGSGLALCLDLFASMLSGGQTSPEISVNPLLEKGISQFFIAISPSNVAHADEMTRIVNNLIEFIRNAPRSEEGKQPRYPGEGTYRIREENNRLGIPVDEAAWQHVQDLAK